MNTMSGLGSQQQPEQQQGAGAGGAGAGAGAGAGGHYAQPFVAQQAPQQVQYVQQSGAQQFVLSPQQNQQGQQYVVMMPSGSESAPPAGAATAGALAQAFGGLGAQASETKRQLAQRGIVKRWNLEKGYGFIQPVEGGDDVFVHHSVIHAQGFKSLMEGSDVEYESLQVRLTIPPFHTYTHTHTHTPTDCPRPHPRHEGDGTQRYLRQGRPAPPQPADDQHGQRYALRL